MTWIIFFNLDTDQGRRKLFDYPIWAILRALRPVSSDPESLSFYSPYYNPVISDEKPLHLRIQSHHLDIQTGDVSPSSIPCFLPKTDIALEGVLALGSIPSPIEPTFGVHFEYISISDFAAA